MAISAVQSTMGQTSQAGSTSSYDRLAKADFLNLLVAQLKYQDPMNPVDNKDFTAQLAQLQTVEQAQQTNEALLALTYLGQLAQASSLVGRTVTADLPDTGPVSGTVSEVRFTGGVAELMVGGKAVGLQNLTKVS